MCRFDLREQIARAFCGYWNGSKLSKSVWEQWNFIATSYELADLAMPIIEADRAGYQEGVLDSLDAANARADRSDAQVKLLWKLLREAADEIAQARF